LHRYICLRGHLSVSLIKKACLSIELLYRVPEHLSSAGAKLVRVQATLLNQLGREPTPEEVSNALGWDASKLAKVRKTR